MATSSTLPRTAGSAPPNFYTQVGPQGQGQAPQGIGANGGQPAPQAQPPAPAAPPSPEQDFLDSTTKLLTVLDKMSKMQPRGMDISKYTDAAAQAIKSAQQYVFTDKGSGKGKIKPQTPGTSAGDMGVAGNPTAASDTSGTQGVASASNATGTV